MVIDARTKNEFATLMNIGNKEWKEIKCSSWKMMLLCKLAWELGVGRLGLGRDDHINMSVGNFSKW